MSGMTHQGQRKGNTIHVWLYSRGGWPKAEAAASALVCQHESVQRGEQIDRMFQFTVVNDKKEIPCPDSE
jgi:hypothetical protein